MAVPLTKYVPLKLLDDTVQNTIRSGVAITSMAQCVEELVLNSVDAGAARISIDVDLSEFLLRVEDDGQGLKKDDLALIGTRYVLNLYFCHLLQSQVTKVNNILREK